MMGKFCRTPAIKVFAYVIYKFILCQLLETFAISVHCFKLPVSILNTQTLLKFPVSGSDKYLSTEDRGILSCR